MDNEKKGSEEKKGEETLVIVENEGGSVELDGKKEKARSEKPSAKLASLKLDFSKKEGYVPALCDGASGICFIFWLYCLLSCLIPAALLPLVLITDFDETEDWIIWAFFTALLTGGIIACCYGLCCAAYGSVIKPKPAPEVLPQFVNLDSDEKKHRKIQVKKLCVIVNPFGGGGKALGLLQDVVLPIWKERGIEVEVIKTEYAGHPIDIGYELNLDNYDGICVVGGDGTLHELVNGVLMRPDKKVIPIGVIPGGTGNSFCEGIGFLSAEIAANKIADGDVCWMDSNKVILGEGKVIYSINTIGVGVVGDVGSVAEEYRWLKEQRYGICGLWLGMRKNTTPMKATLDTGEVIEGDMLTVFFNHTQHFGSKMRATPLAQLDDGRFEAGFVRMASRPEMIRLFLQLKDGRHWSEKFLETRKVKHIDLELKEKGIINIDGEPYTYSKRASIVCEQQNIPVFSPKV